MSSNDSKKEEKDRERHRERERDREKKESINSSRKRAETTATIDRTWNRRHRLLSFSATNIFHLFFCPILCFYSLEKNSFSPHPLFSLHIHFSKDDISFTILLRLIYTHKQTWYHRTNNYYYYSF